MADNPYDRSVNGTHPSGGKLLKHLTNKLQQLAHEFARGDINRSQFEQLYDRYEQQIKLINEYTQALDQTSPLRLRNDDVEDTLHLRRRLAARVIGIAIYSNRSGLPVETLGKFSIDPALVVPMLSSYRAATREIFKAGMRSTMMENDQWLSFVPGQSTTLITLYSAEPAKVQVDRLEQMHRDFETANKCTLERDSADPAMLDYPFLTFIRQAKKRRQS